jgi:hypothetical protein
VAIFQDKIEQTFIPIEFVRPGVLFVDNLATVIAHGSLQQHAQRPAAGESQIG